MKKTPYIAAILALGAGSANACGGIGQPPCALQPPTTITTFGSGLIINPPSRPVTTVQPFGNSAAIHSTGRQTRICRPFGNNSVICH